MIYNKFLEELLAIVGIKDLALAQEREMEELVQRYGLNSEKEYNKGYEDGYDQAESEHEDDYDDGVADGEENAKRDFYEYLANHIHNNIRECAGDKAKEDDLGYWSSILDWLEDEWRSF